MNTNLNNGGFILSTNLTSWSRFIQSGSLIEIKIASKEGTNKLHTTSEKDNSVTQSSTHVHTKFAQLPFYIAMTLNLCVHGNSCTIYQ